MLRQSGHEGAVPLVGRGVPLVAFNGFQRLSTVFFTTTLDFGEEFI
jgi:hypothetical protein